MDQMDEKDTVYPRLRAPELLARSAIAVVLVVAVLGWVGWAANIEVLIRVSPVWPPMSLWSAAMQFTLGTAILVQLAGPSPARVRAASGVAVVVGLLAAVFLLEYLTGRSTGLDQVFFPEAVRAAQEKWPGRPSWQSALSFLMLAIAVIAMRRDGRWARGAWSLSLAGATALPVATAVKYLFEAVLLMDVTRSTGQSIGTIVSLLLLVTATVLARPDRNPVAWLLGRPDRWPLIRLFAILAGLPAAVGASRFFSLEVGLHGDAVWVLSITVGTVVVGVAAFLSTEREQRLQIEKQALNRHLRLLVDHLPALIGYWNREQRNVVANKAYLDFFGHEPSEVRGRHMREILGDSLYTLNLPYIQGVLEGREQNFDRTLVDQRGDTHYTQASYIPDVVDGKVRGFYVLVTDVSARVKAERERADAASLYRLLADNAVDVVTYLRGTEVLWISPSVEVSFGDPVQNWIGTDLRAHVHPDDADLLMNVLQEVASGRTALARFRVGAADGGYHWVEVRCRPYVDAAGNADGTIGSMRVIDDQVAAEQHLERLARFDALTGLVNRAEAIARLEAALERPRNPGMYLGVLFCDIDYFKNVNDTWGHAAGDFVLTTVAARIRECLRDGDTVGRTGGDEILVLLPGLNTLDEALRVADKVRCRASDPIFYGGTTIRVTLSVGCTVASPGESAKSVTARADAAMYRAKEAGRNTITGN